MFDASHQCKALTSLQWVVVGRGPCCGLFQVMRLLLCKLPYHLMALNSKLLPMNLCAGSGV